MPQIRVYLSDDNQAVHELSEETMTIGRLADNTIQIEDGSVSSHHAEITFEGGNYRLHDKGSTNGTFVNGAPATTGVVLKDGDQVRFGSIETVFAADVPAAASQPLPRSERAAASAGGASARPGAFVNSSPFPKPKPKTDALTYAAIALGALGAVGFLAAVALSLTLQAPA
jgi:pSer/pThr/pTyr-binding forkhead associated (FHA) protein